MEREYSNHAGALSKAEFQGTVGRGLKDNYLLCFYSTSNALFPILVPISTCPLALSFD